MEVQKINNSKRKHLLRTEVTALAFFKNQIIAGMGNFLSVFDINSYELVYHTCLLKDSRIHGINEGSDNFIVVFGGRDIAVVLYDTNSVHFVEVKSFYHVGDWIHCIRWLEDENIAIVTAHNNVILWNWKTNNKVATYYCEEKCILYCATIVGSMWEYLTILVGTVYQEVIIWSTSSSCSNNECPVLHRLQGHKGVIFSVHYNPENGRIHTTSDDRSVKCWQVSPSKPNNWNFVEITLLHTMYGHTARVWRSIGLSDCTISIGEDSLLCVWSLEGKLLKRFSAHQGGSIWSIVCSEEDKLLVSGGSDGSISMFSLDYCTKDLNPVFRIPIEPTFLHESTEQNYPRRVALMATGRIITVLQSGHIMHCLGLEPNNQKVSKNEAMNEVLDSTSTSNFSVWSSCYYGKKLASYCLLEVSPCRQFFALASLDGQILIFQELFSQKTKSILTKIIDICAIEGKIFSLKWLSSDSILTCGPSGKLCFWLLKSLEDGTYYLKKSKTLNLPMSKERWITAAILFDNFLICGDRMGSIHLYFLQEEMNENLEPHLTMSKVHGRLGVSHLLVHANKLYSAGRDGTLRKYQILKNDPVLKLLCAVKMPFEWVSSLCIYENDILLMIGFSEKNFIVWSQFQQRLLFEIPCGGGHRSWDYTLQDHFVNFVHIKQKCVFLAQFDLKMSLKPLLQTGFHPREVNCLQVLHKNTVFPIIISGGEDTALRVTLAHSQKVFHALDVLHSHISSIRALVCLELAEKTVLAFSAGGRAQLKAWELSFFELSSSKACIPEIVCRELSSHMLLGRNHKQAKSWRLLLPTVDPETRYMSLCVLLCSREVFVGIGCSDGYFRIFHYHQTQQIFQPVGAFNFHQRCILNIATIFSHIVVTMATDGVAAFWDVSSLLQSYLDSISSDKIESNILLYGENKLVPFTHCKLHQSGIDSYDLKALEQEHYLLATGGDDTALTLSAFHFQSHPNSANLVLQWQMESAHVAQITGVAFADQYIISTSVDQRIFVWKWFCSVEKKLLFVSQVAEYITSVTDVHGLNVWPDLSNGNSFSLCVYGKGVEVIQDIIVEDNPKPIQHS